MPRQERKPEIRWGDRLRAAKRYRQRQETEWRRNKVALLPRTSGGGGYLRRGESINLAWGAFQQMVGAVFARTPETIVRERTPELALVARILTSAVGEDLANMGIRYVTRLCIQDVFWAGFGVCMEKLQSDVTSAAFRYTPEGQKPEDDKEAPKTEDGIIEVPDNQQYSVIRVHPESFLVDPSGIMPNMGDHKWAAIEFYPTLYDLKNDDLFEVDKKTLDGLIKVKVTPTMREGVERQVQAVSDVDEDDEFVQVRIQEIHDRVNRELLYIPTGMDKIIGRRDWPVELRQNRELLFPWSVLYFNENPDEFWPEPEISTVRPQLEQYSILFKTILDDAVRKFRRYLYRSDLVGRQEADKIRSGGPVELVGVDGNKFATGKPDLPLDQILRPIQEPEVKRDLLAVAQFVKQAVHEIMGAGDLASAGMRPTRSATEAAALSDFLRSRMTNRTENVDAFFKRVSTLHVLCLQETLAGKRRVRMVDRDGMTVWKEYDRQRIAGDFDFEVTAGSSMPQNTELTRQENIAFFQQAMPIIMQSGGDPRPMIEWIAPFYRVPQHMVDQLYRGHRQALMKAALMLKQSFYGQQTDPEAFMTAVSEAILSGLSQSEIMAIDTQAAQAASQAQTQPGGLPGRNPANQTIV